MTISSKKMIINYLETNGPSTVKDLTEGISSKYKTGLTSKEISNYIRIMKGHNEVVIKGTIKSRDGTVNIWGLPGVVQTSGGI